MIDIEIFGNPAQAIVDLLVDRVRRHAHELGRKLRQQRLEVKSLFQRAQWIVVFRIVHAKMRVRRSIDQDNNLIVYLYLCSEERASLISIPSLQRMFLDNRFTSVAVCGAFNISV